jgi:hypothetical protein
LVCSNKSSYAAISEVMQKLEKNAQAKEEIQMYRNISKAKE